MQNCHFADEDWKLFCRNAGYSMPREMNEKVSEEYRKGRMGQIRRQFDFVSSKGALRRTVHIEMMIGSLTVLATVMFALLVFVTKPLPDSNQAMANLNNFITFIKDILLISFTLASVWIAAVKREEIEKYGGQKFVDAITDLLMLSKGDLHTECLRLGALISQIKDASDARLGYKLPKKGFCEELALHTDVRESLESISAKIWNEL